MLNSIFTQNFAQVRFAVNVYSVCHACDLRDLFTLLFRRTKGRVMEHSITKLIPPCDMWLGKWKTSFFSRHHLLLFAVHHCSFAQTFGGLNNVD